MISQNCPRCGSKRIRRGYHPTAWFWRLLGRYSLLCNSCNWEFIGFAVPGTVSSQPKRKKRKKAKNDAENSTDFIAPLDVESDENGSVDEEVFGAPENAETPKPVAAHKRRVKKRVRLN